MTDSPQTRVLIVEDERAYAHLLRGWLMRDERRRYDICWVGSLREAITQMESKPFDAVMLDLGLPDSQGPVTVDRVREVAPDIPLVVLSASSDENTVYESLQRGAQEYLVKDPTVEQWLARSVSYAVERQRAEQALLRERRFVEKLMQASPVGIVMVDPQGRITYANRQAEKVLGRSREDIAKLDYNAPGWEISTFGGCPMPDQDLPFRRVMQTRQPVMDMHLAIRWENGEKRLLSVNGVPLTRGNGEMDGVVMTIEDITERWQAEQDIKQFSRRLLGVREEEKRSLSGVLHHESGSFAVGFGSRIDALEEAIAGPDKESSAAALREMRLLLDDFLARMKKVAFELRPADLDILGLSEALRQYVADVVRDSHPAMNLSLDDGCDDVGREQTTVLFRVVQECLTNALRHARAKRVDIALRGEGDCVVAEVKDDGQGFDLSELASRTSQHLGMLAMREMTEGAGGIMETTSSPGKGTSVSIRLPRHGLENPLVES